MTDTRDLVLGTHNRKKGLELQRLLAPFGFRLMTLSDFPQALQVAEDGQTFAENAQSQGLPAGSALKPMGIGRG